METGSDDGHFMALRAPGAVMLASRLASCAATKASVARPSRAFAIFVSTSSGVPNPSTVESREASALASALPRRRVQGRRGDGVQESPPQRKCRRPRACALSTDRPGRASFRTEGRPCRLCRFWSPEGLIKIYISYFKKPKQAQPAPRLRGRPPGSKPGPRRIVSETDLFASRSVSASP